MAGECRWRKQELRWALKGSFISIQTWNRNTFMDCHYQICYITFIHWAKNTGFTVESKDSNSGRKSWASISALKQQIDFLKSLISALTLLFCFVHLLASTFLFVYENDQLRKQLLLLNFCTFNHLKIFNFFTLFFPNKRLYIQIFSSTSQTYFTSAYTVTATIPNILIPLQTTLRGCGAVEEQPTWDQKVSAWIFLHAHTCHVMVSLSKTPAVFQFRAPT